MATQYSKTRRGTLLLFARGTGACSTKLHFFCYVSLKSAKWGVRGLVEQASGTCGAFDVLVALLVQIYKSSGGLFSRIKDLIRISVQGVVIGNTGIRWADI